MAECYDLNIDISYSLRSGYKSLLKHNEWVRGLPVQLLLKVANNSAKVFPGAKVNAVISEHGQSMGTGALEWTITKPLNIPHLEPNGSAKLGPFTFVPLLEGLCEIKIALEESPSIEFWISGERQTARRNRLNAFYSVARWQDMEIINLLTKLTKGGQ